MVRDTHTLRRSILSHLENDMITSLSELGDAFPSASVSELSSAVNFLKMVKMVEVEEDLIAKTDSNHQTPLAQVYNVLKVGKTYNRKQIKQIHKELSLSVSPNNIVNQLAKHGGLIKKSGNSFECTALPPLLGVTSTTEEENVGTLEIVSANRRVIWEALSNGSKTRDELYKELPSVYPSLNKTKISQNLSLLAKQGCIVLDHDTKLATQLDYNPFEVDIFYHEIKSLREVNYNSARKICKKVGLNSKPTNLLNSLAQFDAIEYTDVQGVFNVLPLPQIERVEVEQVVEQVEVVQPSIESLLLDVKQAKQVFDQITKEHELKVKEVSTLRKRIKELTEKADELESEIHSEVSVAKQKLEEAQEVFKDALSIEGLIG
tara:strand:- start:736 stop:1863 length:1128 start_codon:yes stop_codon:yes gene_type:complete